MIEVVRRADRFLLDLIYPPSYRCLCCREDLPEGEYGPLCGTCVRALAALAREEDENRHEPPEGLAFVSCAYPYRGEAKKLVYELKYYGRRRAAAPDRSGTDHQEKTPRERIYPGGAFGKRARPDLRDEDER